MDDELKTAAEAWLKASHDYYDLMRRRGLAGGCIWLTSQSGAMVIFTRGEFRERLLHNIEMEIDAKRVHQFGVAELPSDEK